jgi:hypothetical protein
MLHGCRRRPGSLGDDLVAERRLETAEDREPSGE